MPHEMNVVPKVKKERGELKMTDTLKELKIIEIQTRLRLWNELQNDYKN